MTPLREPASFRDPSGFLYRRDGVLYRQVNQSYAQDYDLLLSSGLYRQLVDKQLLIAHTESEQAAADPELAYRILHPDIVPFISYPYEWSFSQLKDAALATLQIQQLSLQKGMSLKDASAYNIQFVNGKPLLIDTLSFEQIRPGEPWVAYRQFCQHFLAPLALMAYTDIRLGSMLRTHIDGVPLDLAGQLLPRRTRWNLNLQMHIHMHARAQQKYAGQQTSKHTAARNMSQNAITGILQSLRKTIEKLNWQPGGTEWSDYYDIHNYSSEALSTKAELVQDFIRQEKPHTLWDLGGNTGRFSRLGSELGIDTICFDIDPTAVEMNYQQVRARQEKKLLPLLLDLTNPSPALGWAHSERQSLIQRGPAGMVLALALVHHLAISNNVPLAKIAAFFAQLSPILVIEFVPKSDSQVQKLLASRQDIFADYTRAGFEQAFESEYHITAAHEVSGSERVLYLMKRRD